MVISSFPSHAVFPSCGRIELEATGYDGTQMMSSNNPAVGSLGNVFSVYVIAVSPLAIVEAIE